MTLVVNPYSGVVHRQSCKYAVGAIPWTGGAKSGSDKPCRVCAPDMEAASDAT